MEQLYEVTVFSNDFEFNRTNGVVSISSQLTQEAAVALVERENEKGRYCKMEPML
ncbi:hypothetical protein ACFYXS_02690 [Streptomyces sp. NPDC002574]|uniref:hypothetical protein n=1 Tax=Streptomyces sp. NPDC002574 TaxID=3364652 RepID=UPI00368068AD